MSEMETAKVRLTELKDLKSQQHLEIMNASVQDMTTDELNQSSVINERVGSFPAWNSSHGPASRGVS